MSVRGLVLTDKRALAEWDEFVLQIQNSTPVDLTETEDQKKARMKQLESDGNEEAWFNYYFPKYCKCPSAEFHKESTRKFLRAIKFKTAGGRIVRRLRQVRRWARGLSKTTRRMMEIMYKKFVQKLRVQMLLVSKSQDMAERLLDTYKVNFAANQRLINDYGLQVRQGKWTQGEFTTRDGCSFRAVGIEQSPRGAKNEDMRVNILLFDDIDEDEVCRNPDRLQARWERIEKAFIPTVDIAEDYYILFDNNIIAEDSITVRYSNVADDVETINIRDESGKSVWPEKNSEEDIDYMLSGVSYESAQSEYFNNPMSQGKTFPEMKYAKCPPLSSLPFVLVYADPATSNKDKPSLKSKAHTSTKCVIVLGWKNNIFYVYKVWLNHGSNASFINWIFQARDYIHARAPKTTVYYYMENNSLQDPFFQQVLKPLIAETGKARKVQLSVLEDTRSKPDKWTRIEGTLEPLNRNGQLLLNADEKDDEDMKRLHAQFTTAKATSKLLDGPDATEGGVFLIKEKINTLITSSSYAISPRPSNPKRL